MNYYFLLPELGRGGAEQVSLQLAHKIKNEGKKVIFVNIGKRSGELLDQIEGNFELISLNCSRVLGAFVKLYNFFKDKNEVVIFSSREHLSVVVLIVNIFLKKRVIVRIPSMPKNKLGTGWTGFKEKIILKLNKCLLPIADVVISQTDEMRDQILNVYPRLLPSKVITLYNPINSERICSLSGNSNPFSNTKKNFLAVGNMSIAKGYETLLDAFKLVKQQDDNAHLTIIGRNNTEYGKSLTKEFEKVAGVDIKGFMPNPYPYIKYCDVFVLSSRMEGFPNVVLEAMALNRPVVATECVPIISKIIENGINGYTVPIEDSVSLSNKMLQSLSLNKIKNTYNLFDKDVFLNIFKI